MLHIDARCFTEPVQVEIPPDGTFSRSSSANSEWGSTQYRPSMSSSMLRSRSSSLLPITNAPLVKSPGASFSSGRRHARGRRCYRPLLALLAFSVLFGGAYLFTRPSLPTSTGGGLPAGDGSGEAAHRRRAGLDDVHVDNYHAHQEAMGDDGVRHHAAAAQQQLHAFEAENDVLIDSGVLEDERQAQHAQHAQHAHHQAAEQGQRAFGAEADAQQFLEHQLQQAQQAQRAEEEAAAAAAAAAAQHAQAQAHQQFLEQQAAEAQQHFDAAAAAHLEAQQQQQHFEQQQQHYQQVEVQQGAEGLFEHGLGEAAAHEQVVHGHEQHPDQLQQQHFEQQQQHFEQQQHLGGGEQQAAGGGVGEVPPPRQLPSLYDSGLSALDIHGQEVHFSDLRGRALVILNAASHCGYTESNYKGLQQIYERYSSFGLEVLAFPCNQFGNQEPGSPEEILQFVETHFQVTFPMMGKVDVNGEGAHPVFAFLKEHTPPLPGHPANEDIGWNFAKFLVDKWGHPVKRYGSDLIQYELETDIYNELVKPYPAR